jgi:nucleotide-binding universal stress UspA family protein
MLSPELFKGGRVGKMAMKAHSTVRVQEKLRQDSHADPLNDLERMPQVQNQATMRILIPLEGTRESEKPIPLAQQLATAPDAEIYLLRVVELKGGFSPLRSAPDIVGMIDDAERYLSDLTSRFKLPANHTRLPVRESDNAAKEIITTAGIEGIDLIMMASHCRSRLGQVTRGSVCSEVIRSRVCPVLCVPLARPQPSRRRHGLLARRR